MLGTLVATAACIAAARRSYELAFSWVDAKEIVKRGSKAVVPVVTLFIVHSADVVLLSRYASHSEVGIYRVVSRFAAVPSYFASAFLMAWAPLERGVMFQSTYRHVGEERVRGAILTYYLLAGLTLVMLLDLTAPGLMLLVGSQYRSAAMVIPLAGAGFVCYGLFIVLVRSVVIERRMLFYGLGGVMACVLDIGISSYTIPRLGLYGVPAGMIAGLVLTCVAWIALVQRVAEKPLSFEARPLAGLAGAVAIAVAIQQVGLRALPAERSLVLVGAFSAYLAAVVLFGVVQRPHWRLLGRLSRTALRQRGIGADPSAGLEQLEPRPRNLLAAIERDGRPLDDLAGRLGRSERELRGEYVAALRTLIGAPAQSGEHDGRIAAYLLSTQPEAQRDLIGRGLIEEDVDGMQLMELDEAARRLRALPRETWARVAADAPAAARSRWRIHTRPRSRRRSREWCTSCATISSSTARAAVNAWTRRPAWAPSTPTRCWCPSGRGFCCDCWRTKAWARSRAGACSTWAPASAPWASTSPTSAPRS